MTQKKNNNGFCMTARLDNLGCNQDGRLMRRASYKTIVGEPERHFRTVVVPTLHLMIQEAISIGYNTIENADADFLFFKNYIASIGRVEVQPAEAGGKVER